MKKVLTKLIPLIASFISCNALAGFINYLDMTFENESNYQALNIVSTKTSNGKLKAILNDSLLPNATTDVANFAMNFAGQLSQDLSFDLYDTNAANVGSCKIHIGVGSYLAKPDFTGSFCKLQNGDYLQVNPRYEIGNNTYHTYYKLTKNKSFSRVILFGDSMSDNGNLYKRSVELSLIFPISPILPISPPYYKGRFSDGQVWIELLSKKLNIPDNSLLNYAYGGASVQKDFLPVPNLDKQVNKYLNWNRTGDPYALYVVWMGANDILRHKNLSDNVLVGNILSGIEANIRRLIKHGAKHILSPMLPDLSMTPDSIERDQRNGNTDYSERVKILSQKYNLQHLGLIQKLNQEFPDVDFMTFDVFEFLNKAHDNAAEYGFKYIHERCNPNNYWDDEQEICATPKQYVFWDGLHPSSKAHSLLADLMYKVVTQNGYQPNLRTFKAALPDDFVVRNQQAITELQRDVVSETRRDGYSSSLGDGLRMVIDQDIPLF